MGFEPAKNWQSCYFHRDLQLFLIVYVDDFKMAGPPEAMKKGWALIRKNLILDDPTPFQRFLGCLHIICERTSPISGRTVRALEYDMSGFMYQCVSV